jgi:hypothetical protein
VAVYCADPELLARCWARTCWATSWRIGRWVRELVGFLPRRRLRPGKTWNAGVAATVSVRG